MTWSSGDIAIHLVPKAYSSHVTSTEENRAACCECLDLRCFSAVDLAPSRDAIIFGLES